MNDESVATLSGEQLQMLSVADAARYLRVSESTLWRWINNGTLPAYRIGPRRVWLKPADLSMLAEPARTQNLKRRRSAAASTQQERGLAAIEAARAFQSEILKKGSGERFSPSWEILGEVRGKRTQQLS